LARLVEHPLLHPHHLPVLEDGRPAHRRLPHRRSLNRRPPGNRGPSHARREGGYCRRLALDCAPPGSPALPPHPPSPPRSPRDFLWQAGGGCGGLALTFLLARDAAASKQPANPLAARAPHFPAKAKSVIFLFMVGGPSPVDLFDPKLALKKWHGKPLPESFGKP